MKLFSSPAVTIVFTGFLKQNLCPFQKLLLWFILITFLKFRKFQPRHFYKISSYKKGYLSLYEDHSVATYRDQLNDLGYSTTKGSWNRYRHCFAILIGCLAFPSMDVQNTLARNEAQWIVLSWLAATDVYNTATNNYHHHRLPLSPSLSPLLHQHSNKVQENKNWL